ncbi:MAG TPA: thiamine phosphate synthase [Stellaceae bacterium]|jgi:thiamine-phosphate pyrophosphorylase|nr:thiamine phosphate synthase [Stellaceae bacterium]
MPCRLYLITPPAIDLATFPDQLAAALDAGDVASVQLRLKQCDDDTIRRAADALRPVVQRRDRALILNDRPDLALETGCDGVHLGQDDMKYQAARQILGLGRVVGMTCHDSRHLAMEAAEAGADYVAFGAFFPTGTKEPQGHPAPEILEWWTEIFTVPCVAIGGITPANCAPLVKAGADFLAVISSVWNHPDGPAAAVKEFNRVIAAAG